MIIRIVPFVLLVAAAGGAQTLSFSDQTDTAGLTAVHSAPPGLLKMLGGGATADFDQDGWQDLFVLGGGLVADFLFLNDGDGTFTDRAGDWGVAVAHVGGGLAVGDVDDDGWVDMFVASLGTPALTGPGFHKLYRNLGNGFVDVAQAAGVTTTSETAADGLGACFGDVDLDGDLDLFVAGWIPGSGGNRLFENAGDGTFTDVTAERVQGNLQPVRGFSPYFVDMDGDHWPELLLAADFGTTRYYVNAEGTFVDQTQASGANVVVNGMGQCVGDVDGDLRLDWYVTAIANNSLNSGNRLYLNQAAHQYDEAAVPAGVNDGAWGWGTVALDVDHDGDLDIVETNGWSNPAWTMLPSYLFLNDGTGTFTDVAAATGLDYAGNGLGLIHFDADNDGDQDLLFTGNDQPVAYYRNDLSGEDTHSLRVVLDDGGSPEVPPDGYGALVRVTVAGTSQVRPLAAGASYLSQCDLAAHFGLGAATVVDELVVTWPDGTMTFVEDVPADQTVSVTCCTGWKSVGPGLAGAAGSPWLTGTGPIAGGASGLLLLESGVPDGGAFLVGGFSAPSKPFKQGVLVPSVDAIQIVALDALGGFALPVAWPVNLGADLDVYLQAWLPDPSGPAGWSASNGLRARTP